MDNKILEKMVKGFRECKEKCIYHEEFNSIKNKDEVFKALQSLLKVLAYHEHEKNRLPAEVKGDILTIMILFSTQFSTFNIVDWFIDTLEEIEKQKNMN